MFLGLYFWDLILNQGTGSKGQSTSKDYLKTADQEVMGFSVCLLKNLILAMQV